MTQASDRTFGPRRPTLILNYGTQAGSREDTLAQPWDLLFDRLVVKLTQAKPLLPRGSTPAARTTEQTAAEAANQLIDLLDRTGIALLVVGAHAAGTSGVFWLEVARVARRRGGRRCSAIRLGL